MVSPREISPKQQQTAILTLLISGDVDRRLIPFVLLLSLEPIACNYFHLLFTRPALFTRVETTAETGEKESEKRGLVERELRGGPTNEINRHQ